MAGTSVAAARQSANCRSGKLVASGGFDRSHHDAHRFADFSLAILQHASQHSGQFGWLDRRWRIFGWRRRFGELVMSLSKDDHDRIARAIRAAEARTSGEIVCVLAQTSSHVTGLPVFIAAVVALAFPWLLTAFTAMTVYRMLLLQVIGFVTLLVVLCLPPVRVALMARRARRAIAYRFAMEQF